MRTNDYEKTFSAIVTECAEQGRALTQSLANAGTCEALYLYVRPSTEKENGRLFMARQSAPNPYGYQLVTGEGLRSHIPYEHYWQWIAERSRRAPLYAYGKEAA